MTGRPQAVPNQRAGEKFSGSFFETLYLECTREEGFGLLAQFDLR